MNPRPFRPVGRLEGAYFGVALQCLRDFVEALQQAVATARIDRKLVPLSRRRDDGLLLQVDTDAPCPLGLLHVSGKAVDDLLCQQTDCTVGTAVKLEIALAVTSEGIDDRNWTNFSSEHPTIVQFCTADGAVRTIRRTIDHNTYVYLSGIHDGRPAQIDGD